MSDSCLHSPGKINIFNFHIHTRQDGSDVYRIHLGLVDAENIAFFHNHPFDIAFDQFIGNGFFYLHLNKYRDAAKVLSVYGMLTPLTIAEQTLLADLYNNLGIPFKAALQYEKVVEKRPDKKIYERLTSAWLKACKPEKALNAAQKGLDVYPNLQSLWKLSGWIHYENKEFKKASQAFSKAFTLKQTDSKSLFMHGLCASKAGWHDIARQVLTKAACHSQYKQKALALIRQMEHASDKS